MDKEFELKQLKSLDHALRWFEYDKLNLQYLGRLRREVQKRINSIEEETKEGQ